MGFRAIVPLMAGFLVLAGCQMGSLAGPASDVAPPSALQGPAVEVTPLAPAGMAPAAPKTVSDNKTDTLAIGKPASSLPVVKAKSPSQIACEESGGNFVPFGQSGAMTCQTPTRDGGKQCRRESDCYGVCLARSNTCAPAKPMLGCQAILQNDGRRVDLCID